jgi:6-pyruvoyltetrahydropterin/6-carboxytetrahydropterin synthase
MFRVTRRYEFPASHRLHSEQLSDEENRKLYGKCNHPFGHGHNYVVEVSTRGPADQFGRAVDTRILDALVREQVLAPFSHRNLNRDVNSFEGIVPTSENLCSEVFRRLRDSWSQAFPGEWPKLEKVRIAETARNIFEVRSNEVA